jgi:hypothetical protein
MSYLDDSIIVAKNEWYKFKKIHLKILSHYIWFWDCGYVRDVPESDQTTYALIMTRKFISELKEILREEIGTELGDASKITEIKSEFLKVLDKITRFSREEELFDRTAWDNLIKLLKEKVTRVALLPPPQDLEKQTLREKVRLLEQENSELRIALSAEREERDRRDNE